MTNLESRIEEFGGPLHLFQEGVLRTLREIGYKYRIEKNCTFKLSVIFQKPSL